MKWSLTVAELLEWLGSPPTGGSYDGPITGIADLREAEAGQLTFLSGGKYARYLAACRASVVLLPDSQAIGQTPPAGQLWIRTANPSLALADICGRIEAWHKPLPAPGIHATALVDPRAEVDPSASIGPYCLIGEGARIEAGAILESHVRVDRDAHIGASSWLAHAVHIGWGCRIGRHCRLFSGVVIGADGFGYHSDQTGHRILPQIGIVVVGDHVDIGANACIDRARFAETRIGEGTRIDNLVQIGHNNVLGKHCIICSQVGMAGSNEIGNFVVMAGQVGVGGHLKIADGVTVTGQSGISKDVAAGQVMGGTPARPHREEMRRQVLLKQLPELQERVRRLEEGLGKP